MQFQDCRGARKTAAAPYGMPYSPMMQPTGQPMYGQPMYGGQAPMYGAPGYGAPTMAGAAGPDTVDPAEQIAEQSFIENILRYNKGRMATFYMTYENNKQWNAMRFRGRVETAARDHVIISDPETEKRYILLLINLNWVEFDGEVAYPDIPIPEQVKPFLTNGTSTQSPMMGR